MSKLYANHVTGQEALDTMEAIHTHVKRMMIGGDDVSINRAAALAFVPKEAVPGVEVYAAYIYVYENNRHNTFFFTDIAAATCMFVDVIIRLGIKLSIDAWITIAD